MYFRSKILKILLEFCSLIRTFAPYEVNITNPNDDHDDEL